MLQTSRTIILLLTASAALAACTPKAPKQLPPDPGSNVTTATNTNQGTVQSGAAPGSQADFVTTLMGQDTIYFDTDRHNIDSSDAAALAAQAQWLIKYPGKRATLEGHCDERGTRDYNLALGDKRANAAKNYLISMGVDAGRLTVISYGKERPIAVGSNEEAWAKNRRAVTVSID